VELMQWMEFLHKLMFPPEQPVPLMHVNFQVDIMCPMKMEMVKSSPGMCTKDDKTLVKMMELTTLRRQTVPASGSDSSAELLMDNPPASKIYNNETDAKHTTTKECFGALESEIGPSELKYLSKNTDGWSIWL